MKRDETKRRLKRGGLVIPKTDEEDPLTDRSSFAEEKQESKGEKKKGSHVEYENTKREKIEEYRIIE